MQVAFNRGIAKSHFPVDFVRVFESCNKLTKALLTAVVIGTSQPPLFKKSCDFGLSRDESPVIQQTFSNQEQRRRMMGTTCRLTGTAASLALE